MRKAVSEAEEPEKFAHKKSLGQNFLTSDIVPGWMCDAGEVTTGDIVFEIGPGTGMLTKTLLSRGATVIAVEADERAYHILKDTFASELSKGSLSLHHGDAREITPQSLGLQPYSFKVVANIPYYLSGFLLRSFLENPVQPSSLVFLIQKELAHRIVRDKKESLLALSVKAFGTPRYFKTVTRGHFHPQPKVDSAILQITDINHRHFSEAGARLFFELLHLGLGKKRKQLMTNLKEQYDRDLLTEAFNILGLSPTVRGEDLPLPTWLNLLYTLNPQTKP